MCSDKVSYITGDFTANSLTSGGWEIPGHIPYTHGDHGECGEVAGPGDSEPAGHYPLEGKSYQSVKYTCFV